MARAKKKAKTVKEVEKAAAAKVKEDAKIAKKIAKTVKKVTQIMIVEHSGVTLVGLVIEDISEKIHGTVL